MVKGQHFYFLLKVLFSFAQHIYPRLYERKSSWEMSSMH